MSDKQDIEEFFQKVSDHLDQVNTLIAAAWFIGPDRMAWKDSVETCREELRDFQRELVERYTGTDEECEERVQKELAELEECTPGGITGASEEAIMEGYRKFCVRKARRALGEQAHGHSPRNAPPDYKLPPKDPAPVDTPPTGVAKGPSTNRGTLSRGDDYDSG